MVQLWGRECSGGKLTIEKYGKDNRVLVVNNPIIDEDIDNVRFKRDVQNWIKQPIIEAINPQFPSASICEVFDRKKYMSGGSISL